MSSRTWPASNTVREILRTLAASTGRLTIVGLLGTALLSAGGIAEGREVDRAVRDTQELVDKGRDIVRVRPMSADEGTIDRRRCDTLAESELVEASGGLVDLGTVSVATAPGTPLRSFLGSGSVIAVLDPTVIDDGSRLAISRLAARSAGVVRRVMFTDGNSATALLFDPGPRHPSSSAMVIERGRPQHVEECWLRVRPGTSSAAVDGLVALLARDGPPLIADSVLSTDIDREGPRQRWLSRATQHAWWVIGLVLGLILGLAAGVERSDMAVYRLLGASRWVAGVIGWTAQLVLTAWSAVAAVAAALVLLPRGPADDIAVDRSVTTIVGAAVLAMCVAAVARAALLTQSSASILRRRGD